MGRYNVNYRKYELNVCKMCTMGQKLIKRHIEHTKNSHFFSKFT